MEIYILSACLIVLTIILSILIGMFIGYSRHEYAEKERYQYYSGFSPTVSRDSSPVLLSQPQNVQPHFFGSATAYGRSWHIELWNIADGRAYAKDFIGQVMVGRGGPGNELFWQLRVGDDPTISREQCVIYDRGGFLVIENVSQVNMTQINGLVVMNPYMLQQGYQITMGRSQYIVSAIKRLT